MLRMRRETLLLSVVWVLGLVVDPGLAWSKDGFIDSVLSQYRQSDQASRADTARDGIITEGEFVFSLYGQADARGNNDNQVSREEFLDYYSQLYNISSELATIMFDYLNDPASRDDVITTSDVSLSSFAGRTYATVAEYREGLEKWLRQSLEKLYSILMSPHVISRGREATTNYNGMITSIDTNKDGTISIAELNQEVKRFNPNQPASRTDWVWRNSQRYGGKYPDVSSLAFDFYDRDGDLKLTSRDLQMLAENLDYNGDGKIKKDETLRFMERAYTLSQRMTGRPMTLPLIKCPQPWWSEFEPTPSMEALRAAVDFDDDLDGWITASDLRRWLDIFDSDDNSDIDVSEFSAFNMERYRLNSSMAKTMFDLADINGDQKLNEKDWEFHFKDDFALSLCDARRSILDLARMAGKFHSSQLSGRALRAAMQRKLQEEWAWFQQRRGGGWGRFGGSGGGAGRKGGVASPDGTCKTEELCYNGEYTKAWGRPGAWMWWGMKENKRPGFGPAGFPGNRFPGQVPGGQAGVGNMFPGGLSSLGGMGMPFFPPQTTPLLGGNAPLFGQFQFPSVPAGSDAGLDDGMMSQFLTFKRNALANSADPDSAASPKREMAENYFTHYQKLFTPFVPSEKTTKEIEDTSSTLTTSTNRASQSQPPTDTKIFEPPKQKSDVDSTPEVITPTGTLAPSPETPSTEFPEGKSDGNSDGFDNAREEVASQEDFPFMSYPIFIGFDPWLVGAAPAWGMMGRMKRGEKGEDIPEATRFRRDVSGKSDGVSSDKVPPHTSLPPLPSTPSMSSPDTDHVDNTDTDDTNSTGLDGFGDLDPGTWPDLVGPGSPPLTFGISPIDFWTAMMLENAMLNNHGWGGEGEWLDNQTDTSLQQDGNETHISPEHWWFPELWGAAGFDEADDHTGQEGEEEENPDQSQEETKTRSKRFAGPNMYRSFYFPNYANPSYNMRMRMMRNMMRYRRFYPSFSRMMFRSPWSYRNPYTSWQGRSNLLPYMNRWLRRYPSRGAFLSPTNYWMKRGTVNPMMRRFPQASGNRLSREAGDGERNKRWQDYSWYPGQNSNWGNRYGNMGQSYGWQNQWSNSWMGSGYGDNFWKRDADADTDTDADKEGGESHRSKREADKNNREKRWEKMMWLPMRYISAHWKRFTDWKGWDLINPLNRWPLGNMMNQGENGEFWKRDAQKEEQVEKVKREAGDEIREKRWQSNQMYSSWYDRNNWQGGYNQFSRYGPMSSNMYNNRMNPQWNSYKRRDVEGQESLTRSRRDAGETERTKRWYGNSWYPQTYNSYRWPQSQYSNNRWGMNQWSGPGNWGGFWKRGAQEEQDTARSKREVKSEERKKRWYSNMWNPERYGGNNWQFYSGWNSNRRGMFDGYNQMPGGYGWGGYWKRDSSSEDTGNRQKREVNRDATTKSKRSYGMWNYGSPFSNRMWPRWQNPGCYPYCGMHNGMMYKKRSQEDVNQGNQRSRRSATKEKRQGMFWNNRSPYQNNGWSSGWNSPYNNWHGNQWQNPYFNMWKRNSDEGQEDQEDERIKRDAESANRKRRFGIIWNWRPPYWNRWMLPWQSPYHYNWYMFHKFHSQMPMGFSFGSRMWKRSLDEAPEAVRSKRDTEETTREKRNRMWSGQYPQWNRWSDQWSWPWSSYSGGMHGQFGPRNFGNHMWKRTTDEDSDNSRSKREAEDTTRSKRFGSWGSPGWPWQWGSRSGSWQWWTPYGDMPYGYQMWKRDSNDNPTDARTKRDTEATGRTKRFGGMRRFRSSYWGRRAWPRYSPYHNWWLQRWRYLGGYPGWFNHRNFMWKRDAQDMSESPRVKRETSEESREKRMSWNSGDPYSNMWSRQGYGPSRDWYMNQRWNSYRNMPNWYGYGNNMWKRESQTDTDKPRTKRDTEPVAREKRNWMSWSPRSPYWSRGHQYFPSTQYYNGGQPQWSGYSDFFWKRDTKDGNTESRTKREAGESTRDKRYGNYRNQWSNPHNTWTMNQHWNSYSSMPYPFTPMWKRNSDASQTTRTKRDADDTARPKRQMMGGSQGPWSWGGFYPSNNWNQFYRMPYWSPYGGQFWKRAAEDESEDKRTKRSTDEKGRAKRYMMMNSPYWNRQYSQPMWNRPYPMSGWSNYDFPMWKRNSDQDEETTRSKRDTVELDREKRQGNMWNFGWPRPWYSQQSPSYTQQRWNPHYRRGNGEVSGSHMSKRGSQDETNNGRTKRETTDTERKKRYGMMWNSGLPWQWNNWNMYQSMQPYWHGYGDHMWRRDSEEDKDVSRSKRDTETVDRTKRFGKMWSPMSSNWNMPWHGFNSWYPYSMSNWFSQGNHMWKRDSEVDATAERAKRDTGESGESGKEKRQGMMGNSWSRYWGSTPWLWNSPYGGDWHVNRWNSFNGRPSWYNNGYSMWKREGEEGSEGTGGSRNKREASDTNRDKRFGRNWFSGPQSWDWTRNFPSNAWFGGSYGGWPDWSWGSAMWKRGTQEESDSAQEESDVTRNKRDSGDETRDKRYAMMWNSRSPYGNYWSNQWYNPSNQWYMPQWFGSGKFWKRGTQDSPEEGRTKRDTLGAEKVKRQGMMYPYWSSRSSQRYFPQNNWNMYNNWNSYSSYPGSWAYGMNSGWKREAQAPTETPRSKRNTDDTDRTKRMGGMMRDSWPWPWQSSLGNWWRPSYWGQSMWKREEKEEEKDTQSREKRDTATLDKTKWVDNMKDRKAETNKRQFSFNKQTSPTSKPINSEDSVWRSAKKKFGDQRSWQRRLNQGNSNWHRGGSNKNYGYTTNKALPSNYRTNTNSWMQRPTTGRGYSWQSTPSAYPTGGYNRAGGMGAGSMPSIGNGGWYGGMFRGGNSYEQPYSSQWRGDAGASGYWPMDWDNSFGSYGMYGFSPMGMRYFREAQAKRETQDTDSTGSDDDESGTLARRKRDSMEKEKALDRKKRFSNFFHPMNNFYRYNKMRQMRARWFFYSFCQRPFWWGPQAMGPFRRNATNTEKKEVFFNPTKQSPTAAQWLDSEKEKRQGRFYNNGGYGGSLPGQNGQWNRNRFQSWHVSKWMCPQAWNIMQGNFRGPNNFPPRFPPMMTPYWNHPRWKRSSPTNPRGSTEGDYDDARGRRQWGNFWRGWPRGQGPEDCEEWVSPMPAWSPWRGWNMLRKNREVTGNKENRVKREAESTTLSDNEDDDGEKGKRAAYRCRNWQGSNLYDPNMDMGMGNRMSSNRFGMDSWRNNWMDGNRWSSRRYRRDSTASLDHVASGGRGKRWQQSNMWYPGYGRPNSWPWSPFNFWNQ